MGAIDEWGLHKTIASNTKLPKLFIIKSWGGRGAGALLMGQLLLPPPQHPGCAGRRLKEFWKGRRTLPPSGAGKAH